MKTKIRVLIAEDNPDDAELVVHRLKGAGFEPLWERVDTEPAYLERLGPDLDLILSDHEMPQFSGPRALELLRERGLEVPFIIISGTIGEDVAVEAMRQGAADYFLKDRLTRLGAAVSHALEQSRVRREHRAAVEELRLFHALLQNSNDTFEIVDPHTGAYLDVNEKGCAELGYSRAEYLALKVPDIDPAFTTESWPLQAERIHAAGSLSGEARHRRKDGSTFPIEFNAKWVHLERDYIVTVVRDITDRVREQERVRELAALLDLAQDAIIVRGFHDRRVRYWNKGAESIYGWTAEEAIGGQIADFIRVNPSVSEAVERQLLESEKWNGENRQETKTGQEIIVSTRATLVREASGEPKSVLLINSDVTEHKNLEARLIRAQRMESIGTLAGGVAHDLNNILAPIMMSVPMLRLDLPAEQRDAIITTIEMSAERGAQIVRQVLTFGRGVEGERHPLALAPLVDELVSIIGQTFPKNIAIETELGRHLWPVTGDSTQLHQVLLNLAVNARDALAAHGGKLRLSARNLNVDAGYASMLPDAHAGRYVLLEVADNGSGIPPEIIERIFDPFFTTKGVGHGTGLGLSTVIGIVRSHGGTVQVASEPGQGTTFRIHLPASADSAAPTATATVPAAIAQIPRGNGQLILVVDDEFCVGDTARKALEGHGYCVLLAQDGPEALAHFTQSPDPVQAVLTDLAMPRMDGVALVRALRQLDPQLPVIASTGHAEKAQLAALQSLQVDIILLKPYGTDTLLRTIHEALHPEFATTSAA